MAIALRDDWAGAGVVVAKNGGRPDTWDDRNDWGGMRVTHPYDLALSHAEDGSSIVPWEIARRGKTPPPTKQAHSATTAREPWLPEKRVIRCNG